jgi:hypothetical protein
VAVPLTGWRLDCLLWRRSFKPTVADGGTSTKRLVSWFEANEDLSANLGAIQRSRGKEGPPPILSVRWGYWFPIKELDMTGIFCIGK